MNDQSLLSRLQFGLILLTILGLPWYIIRFTMAGLPLTLPEVIAWLSIAVWLVLKLTTRTINLPPKSWIIISVLWLLIATISSLLSPDLRAALGIFKAYFLLPVVFFFQLYDTIDTRQKLKILLLTGLASALQVAVVCLSQWQLGWPNITPHELIQGRSTATFNTANAVSLAIAPVIIFVSCYLAFKKSTKLILVSLASSLAIILLAVYTSKSEGAWLSLAVIACCLLIIVATRSLWPKLQNGTTIAIISVAIIAMYVIANIGYVALVNDPPQVANPYTRPNFTTMTIRQCTWHGAWNSLLAQPITGNGLAGFSAAYLQHYTCDAEPFTYPHNNILTVWSELGLAGLGIFIGMSILWIKQSLQGAATSKGGQFAWLYWAALLTLVYWLIHGLVDVPYFKNDLSIIWWVVIAILLIARRLDRSTALTTQLS